MLLRSLIYLACRHTRTRTRVGKCDLVTRYDMRNLIRYVNMPDVYGRVVTKTPHTLSLLCVCVCVKQLP